MDILKKLTSLNLRKNRKRTLMTMAGIALSCALIAAVAGMVSSAQESILQYYRVSDGDFHAVYYDVPGNALPYITENVRVKEAHVLRDDGYADAKGSTNDYKPYYHVVELDNDTERIFALKVTAGRLPGNDTELLLSGHVRTNGDIALGVGDTLSLDIGTRMTSDGNVLHQNNPFQPEDDTQSEQIADTKRKTYTVVGVADRPTFYVEGYEAPGYTVFTYGGADLLEDAPADAHYDVAVSFTNMRTFREDYIALQDVLAEYGSTVSAVNEGYVNYNGAFSSSTLQFFVRLAGIISVIIMLTSIFVIRNGFRISVTERNRQYGLLASVGATSRQIKRSVLFEGLICGALAIPIGLLTGVAAVWVLIFILNAFAGNLFGEDFTFVYRISPTALLLSAVLSIVTIYFSCIVPARAAAKITPLAAIRGNDDVNLKHGKVRSSRLVRKIFGIGGVIASNNLQRSRKRYRTTVASLVLSVSVFIALSWFTNSMKRSVELVYADYQYNIGVYYGSKETYSDIANRLSLADDSYNYSFMVEAKCLIEDYGSDYAADYFGQTVASDDDDVFLKPGEMGTNIIIVNRDYFAHYAAQLGIRSDLSTAAILCDDMLEYIWDANGYVSRAVRYSYDIREGDTVHYEVLYPASGNVPETVFSRDVTITRLNPQVRPMGYENWYSPGGFLFVSEDFLEEVNPDIYFDDINLSYRVMHIMSGNPDQTEQEIRRLIRGERGFDMLDVYNLDASTRENRSLILVIEIFLYGFITVITLIGVTNIFNTITANMLLRSREFAMLKSIGMTRHEFHRMIWLESLLYGLRSLLIGVPLGLLGSGLIYRVMRDEIDDIYRLPVWSIVIAAVFVFAIVFLTMRYSLAKINRQNIIETIRSEAV